MIPAEPRFIACRASLAGAGIVLFGIPFEGRVNLRRGADHGPRELRPRAREEIRRFWRPGLRPVMLGGDHTATLAVIEVLAPAIPDLRILQLDAHPDLREEFLGERYNYASAMARVMDVVAPERVFQVGMRTGAREEYQRKAPHLFPAHRVKPLEAVRGLLPELQAHPLYVTIDVDVLHRHRAGGDRPPPGSLPDRRHRPHGSRPGLGPLRPHRHHRLLDPPRSDPDVVGPVKLGAGLSRAAEPHAGPRTEPRAPSPVRLDHGQHG